MKKILVLFLIVFVALVMCSCGSDNSTNNNTDSNETTIQNVVSDEVDIENKNEESLPEDFIGIDTADGYFIDEYIGTAKKVIVPDELDGKKVVGIERDAFYNVAVEEIVLPSGMEKIHKSTFSYVLTLKKVVLNEGLKEIEKDAFLGCGSLVEINFPSTLTTIGKAAFCDCTSLTTITLNEGLTSIGTTSFGLVPFKSVTIPSTVEKINDHSFSENSALEEVRILSKDVEIEENAFDECENLVIYGYAGSTAEVYAQEIEVPFVAIES